MEPEEAPFRGVLGKTSELAVSQHFIATRDIPYTQKEVAEATGLTRQTVAPVLERLVKWQLLASENRGRERVYFLNGRSPLAYALDTLAGAIVEELTGVEVLPRESEPHDYKAWKGDWLVDTCVPASELQWQLGRPASEPVAAA